MTRLGIPLDASRTGREAESLDRRLRQYIVGQKEAIDQSSSAVQFTNLKVEIETRRELLDELLRRQSETEVAVRLQDTRESNVRIIDQALVPSGPSSPSLRKDLTYGLLIGLVVYRTLSLRDIYDMLVEGAEISAVILMVVALASIFAWAGSTIDWAGGRCCAAWATTSSS